MSSAPLATPFADCILFVLFSFLGFPFRFWVIFRFWVFSGLSFVSGYASSILGLSCQPVKNAKCYAFVHFYAVDKPNPSC